MSDRAAAITEDEIRPIRQASGSSSRNYNTTSSEQSEQTEATGATATNPSNPTSTPAAQSSASNEPAPHNGEAESSTRKKSTWVKDIAERYGSISLENKGSVARDHLALERTFLAWLRTSLAFASIGIAITQLFRLNTSLSHRTSLIPTTRTAPADGLPFSPFVGHAIPADMAPYLQDVLASSAPSSTPALGPTLFDQLFSLTADGKSVLNYNVDHASTQDQVYHVASESKIKHLGKPLGATFIGVSILILLVGFHRYFESQYWIIKGKFPASRGSVGFVGLITGGLIIACLVVIVVVDPTSYERKKR